MKKDDTYRSQFRLPYDLYEKLKAKSERNRRSLNAEIVARLDESLKDEPSGRTASRGFSTDKRLSKALQDLELALSQLHEVRDDQEKAVEESQPEKLDVKDDLLK